MPKSEYDAIGMRWVHQGGGEPRRFYVGHGAGGDQVGWISFNKQYAYRFPQVKGMGHFSAGKLEGNLEDKRPGAESNYHIPIDP